MEIVCDEHGAFFQRPDKHLKGSGCPFCASIGKRSLVYGVGINDVISYEREPYEVWHGMFRRCYSREEKFRAYANCVVDKNWHRFSNFLAWYDKNHVDGFVIDKDIIGHGMDVYSQDTCLFVPPEINALFILKSATGSGLHRGVVERNGRYVVRVSDKWLGTFDSYEQAVKVYEKAKREKVLAMLEKYKNKLNTHTYYAILNFNF